MTTPSHGKGSSEKYVKSVKDWNYKVMVLENYNATKSILIATAQSKFEKSMSQGCYLAVSSISNMVLPFVKNDEMNVTSTPIKNKIDALLEELNRDYLDVQTMSINERADYIHKCEQVLGLLPPLFSYIGLYVKTTERGIFYYPDKEIDYEA